MKTNNIFFVVILLSLISIGVNGQNHKAMPTWYFSKDVQRVSNKAYFERLGESQLTVKSLGYPHWIISKAVTRISNPTNETVQESGNMVSKYPYWTLSKGITQIKN